MRPLGRSGRRRCQRKKYFQDRPISQAHDESFIALLRWLKEKSKGSPDDGLNSKCLGPCEFCATGRGLKALRDIKSGDRIISLPVHVLLTVETVLSTHLGTLIKKWQQAFTPQALLTLYLAAERDKGSSSSWSDYIDTLPKTYTTPIYFSSHEIGLLTPRSATLALKAIGFFTSAKQQVMNFYKAANLCSLFSLSDESLRWAWSTVETRSVYLETKQHPNLLLEPEQSNVALAPFLDFLNHNDTTEMKAGLNPVTNHYEITTYTPYNKHSQVFISYGSHDNVKLLINYGFALPTNINNFYRFSLDDVYNCFPTVSHWNKKVEKLKDSQLHKNMVCDCDGVSWSLVTAMKLCALTWDELHLWKRLVQGDTVSHQNTKVALDMAGQLVKTGLREARKHLNFVDSQPHSAHKNLIRCLAEDDVKILEEANDSLKKLGS